MQRTLNFAHDTHGSLLLIGPGAKILREKETSPRGLDNLGLNPRPDQVLYPLESPAASLGAVLSRPIQWTVQIILAGTKQLVGQNPTSFPTFSPKYPLASVRETATASAVPRSRSMAACRLRSPEKHAADQRRVLPRRTVATALHARAPKEHISPAGAGAIFGGDGGEQTHGALAARVHQRGDRPGASFRPSSRRTTSFLPW